MVLDLGLHHTDYNHTSPCTLQRLGNLARLHRSTSPTKYVEASDGFSEFT